MEHVGPTSVWADGHMDKYPVGIQKVIINFLPGKRGVVVCITTSVPSELLPLLLNEMCSGYGHLLSEAALILE